MKIEHKEIDVRELTASYVDNNEKGARGDPLLPFRRPAPKAQSGLLRT
jgi:hypothetical protein